MALTLVTGAAGFIGSHLAARLLEDGHTVRGVDCFTGAYSRAVKEANLLRVSAESGVFTFAEVDLVHEPLGQLVKDVEYVFHLAGQPGVRSSWADGFRVYSDNNIVATQRLLEAAVGEPLLRRFILASSSSVYGNASKYPTIESDPTRPHSPYGVTKLAAEHLCGAYVDNWGLPAVALRFFTVYGAQQRPDMAIYRLIESALRGDPFPLYGDGGQIRDFTHVADVVRASILASTAELVPGSVLNVAGGSSTLVSDLIELVGELSGREVTVDRKQQQPGDVRRTGGAIDRAWNLLGWVPSVSLRDGLSDQIAWQSRQR